VVRTKREYWAKLLAEQEASGDKNSAVLPRAWYRGACVLSVAKALREEQTVRFAVLEARPADGEPVGLHWLAAVLDAGRTDGALW